MRLSLNLLLLASLLSVPPVFADQTDPRLENLFSELKKRQM